MTKKISVSGVKCCIYARVSTEEQAERDLSIPFQIARCRYHAQGLGWEVVKEYIDAGESARTDKRHEFQKMIVAARAKEFDIILVHKFDRFARNDYDFVVYEKELEELGITLDSVSEPGDASTPAGYIGRRMMQIISTWYSKNLAVEARKGMKEKVEKGGWPKLAPPGYLNVHDKTSAWVEIDPQLGPLVTKAFQEMATGSWTLKEWANQVYSLGHRSRKGNRIAVGIWSSIFHNRFYLGETWLKNGDMPTKGNQIALTDEDTFSRVQEVLRSHDNYKQRTQRHKYLLQGMLYSEDTNTPCFVETHPKKRISYYRTKGKVDGRQIFYNTRDIDKQLFDAMRDITITDDQKAALETQMHKWFASEVGDNGEWEQAKQRLVKLERMEKNLQELFLEEEISKEDFKERRVRIQAERTNLKYLVDTIESHRGLVRADFEVGLQLANKLDSVFEKGDNEVRRLLCETVFKQVRIRKGKIVDVELNSPFTLIVSQTKGSESLLSGQPAKNQLASRRPPML
ncbi:MAG: recombinase family protein [Dehalococcoidales bacterium]|nr:recombinase family protein [Dehalococcoidales bacterium]